MIGLLLLKSSEKREEKKPKKNLVRAILLGGAIAMVSFIAIIAVSPGVEQASVGNTGSQISIGREKGEVNVKKVKINPDNTVQGADESVSLYCGLKTREIDFDNKTYYLSFSKQIADNYYNMEFVAKGDVVGRYKEMILVQCNTSDVKPMQVLFAVMKGVQQNTANGEARQYPISQNGKKVGFDFVTGESNFFKEWNMFSYAPLLKSKTGVLMLGISKRTYINDNGYENFGEKTKDLKKKYEDKMMNFQLEKLF